MQAIETDLLNEMCIHCNNYFNPQNSPQVPDDQRAYPAAFLALAARIAQFVGEVEKSNVTNSVVAATAETVDLDYSSWTKAFSRELSLYKRARFI